MDGHFVPNISFGPNVLAALRKHTKLPFDVHLMIAPVDPYLDAFIDAGADHISLHPEAGPHLHRSLQHIRAAGKKAGVVLNPATSPDAIDLGARPDRHHPGDVGEPRFWRAELPAVAIAEDRSSCAG